MTKADYMKRMVKNSFWQQSDNALNSFIETMANDDDISTSDYCELYDFFMNNYKMHYPTF